MEVTIPARQFGTPQFPDLFKVKLSLNPEVMKDGIGVTNVGPPAHVC